MSYKKRKAFRKKDIYEAVLFGNRHKFNYVEDFECHVVNNEVIVIDAKFKYYGTEHYEMRNIDEVHRVVQRLNYLIRLSTGNDDTDNT